MKDAILGRWGPFTIERTASGPKMGWIMTVRDGSGERVEIRTTPKGNGMTTHHILFSSEEPKP